jgi:glutathionyl-hydroquinone reductase
MLVNGKWTAEWHPVQAKDEKGGFVRQTSSFRNWVTPYGSAGPTGEGGFAAEAGRYHLYVALICPWASRTLIGRKLKKLDDAISVSVVEPALTDQGWRFGDYPGADRDELNGVTYLHEIYTRADPTFTGRATVPVLWKAPENHRQQRVGRHPPPVGVRTAFIELGSRWRTATARASTPSSATSC